MSHLLFAVAIYLMPQQDAFCKIYGTMYEVNYPSQADIIVYEELSEGSADLIVYEETNRLYADKPGKWFFVDKPEFADYRVYFTEKKSKAQFSAYFTRFESFAGCNR